MTFIWLFITYNCNLRCEASDYFFPEAAKTRKVRESLRKCFDIADPPMLSQIDDLLIKYDGRERIMFAKLSRKYAKVPQCQYGF